MENVINLRNETEGIAQFYGANIPDFKRIWRTNASITVVTDKDGNYLYHRVGEIVHQPYTAPSTYKPMPETPPTATVKEAEWDLKKPKKNLPKWTEDDKTAFSALGQRKHNQLLKAVVDKENPYIVTAALKIPVGAFYYAKHLLDTGKINLPKSLRRG